MWFHPKVEKALVSPLPLSRSVSRSSMRQVQNETEIQLQPRVLKLGLWNSAPSHRSFLGVCEFAWGSHLGITINVERNPVEATEALGGVRVLFLLGLFSL